MFTINHFLYFFIYISSAFAFSPNVSDDDVEYVPRVVNGYPAKLGDVPYQVAFKALIQRPRLCKTFCGGVIMTPKTLLSAAHCFVNNANFCQKILCSSGSLRSLSGKFAVAGNLRNVDFYPLVESDTTGQWRKLRKIVYPWTYTFPRDDIAIVFLRSPFIYNSFVNYVPIASKSVDYQGKCLVSGYGRISQKDSSDKLLLAQLDLIPMRACNRKHRRNMRRFVCTSSLFTDVGKGDSGGPLVCSNTGDPNEEPGKGVLIGVVSGHRYGAGSFFTRVSSYYKYVKRNKSNKLHFKYSVVIIIETTILLF